jgi:hypothetical protein
MRKYPSSTIRNGERVSAEDEKAEQKAAADRRREELAARNRAAEAKKAAERGDEQLAADLLRED